MREARKRRRRSGGAQVCMRCGGPTPVSTLLLKKAVFLEPFQFDRVGEAGGLPEAIDQFFKDSP